jgi:hypothetical protein
VDQDGHKVYSDTPRPGARRIEAPAVKAPGTGSPEITPHPRVEETAPAAAPSAPTSVTVLAPANDETLYDNTGTVDVRLAVTSPPAAGVRFQVYLDGEALPELRATTSFSLQDVSRGTHTLQVAAVDSRGTVLATAPAVTFNLWHGSGIFNNPTWTFPKAPTAPTAPAAPRMP